MCYRVRCLMAARTHDQRDQLPHPGVRLRDGRLLEVHVRAALCMIGRANGDAERALYVAWLAVRD
jgi:hypothetical protein